MLMKIVKMLKKMVIREVLENICSKMADKEASLVVLLQLYKPFHWSSGLAQKVDKRVLRVYDLCCCIFHLKIY